MLETVLLSKGLSKKEVMTVLFVFRGMSNKEAATAMNVKPKTIKFHLTNVFKKLNVKSRLQLVTTFYNAAEGV